jgi:hypothetical protein
LKKSSYQPSQEDTTKKASMAPTKDSTLPAVMEGSVPMVSKRVTRVKNNLFLLAFCQGPVWNTPNDADDADDDDDSIIVPVNTKQERTRSPIPLFKKCTSSSLTSEEEEEDVSGQRQQGDHKSWIPNLFSQNGDDNDSTLMNSTFAGSNTDDEDDVGDMPAIQEELVYQAQQLGKSLSHIILETTSVSQRRSHHPEEQVVPIIVYQQPDSMWEMNPTTIQPDDCSS